MPPIYLLSPLPGGRCADATSGSTRIINRDASNTDIGPRIAGIAAEGRREVKLPRDGKSKAPESGNQTASKIRATNERADTRSDRE